MCPHFVILAAVGSDRQIGHVGTLPSVPERWVGWSIDVAAELSAVVVSTITWITSLHSRRTSGSAKCWV